MQTAYLGLGTNLGNRAENIRRACDSITALTGIDRCRMSPVYETDPVGGPADQPRYLNAAIELDTDLDAEQLLHQLLAIELQIGRAPRRQRIHWGPREVDIDLLLYGQQVLHRPGLVVPHPRMHLRFFVLFPLADLAPKLIHPVLGRTIADLLQEFQCVGNTLERKSCAD